jgi:hypothetical protein
VKDKSGKDVDVVLGYDDVEYYRMCMDEESVLSRTDSKPKQRTLVIRFITPSQVAMSTVLGRQSIASMVRSIKRRRTTEATHYTVAQKTGPSAPGMSLQLPRLQLLSQLPMSATLLWECQA